MLILHASDCVVIHLHCNQGNHNKQWVLPFFEHKWKELHNDIVIHCVNSASWDWTQWLDAITDQHYTPIDAYYIVLLIKLDHVMIQ